MTDPTLSLLQPSDGRQLITSLYSALHRHKFIARKNDELFPVKLYFCALSTGSARRTTGGVTRAMFARDRLCVCVRQRQMCLSHATCVVVKISGMCVCVCVCLGACMRVCFELWHDPIDKSFLFHPADKLLLFHPIDKSL